MDWLTRIFRMPKYDVEQIKAVAEAPVLESPNVSVVETEVNEVLPTKPKRVRKPKATPTAPKKKARTKKA